MGDRAQLGHSSALLGGQSVPGDESWHGSPAEAGGADYRVVPPARVSRFRKVVFSAVQLLAVLVPVTAVVVLLVAIGSRIPQLSALLGPGHEFVLSRGFYVAVLVVSLVVFFGVLLLGLALMVTVPRLLSVLVRPGRVYRLYGLHHVVQATVATLTNSQFFMLLFGDSSFVVHFVRGLGYHLSPVEQTGSNFGTEMRHDSPYLNTVGTGTMVSDGLTLMNADYSSTSFRLSPVSIGKRNFVGNNVAYPAGGRTGDNCLLGTKVMIPVDGPVRENVGLLGSPPFEIPRTVHRGASSGRVVDLGERRRRRRLAAKNRHNARAIATVLFLRWIQFFAVVLVVGTAADLYGDVGGWVIPAAILLIPLFGSVYSALLERAVLGFRALRPQFCSIYDRYFWGHERLWKFYTRPIFVGTPFNTLLWRLAGARIGRRVLDDGCVLPEKSLTAIGDDTVLNAGSVVQCHSLEDGVFTSDHSTIGAGCTVGVGAFVHYGVTMGDEAELAADAFLMKGEEVAPATRWLGNPARSAAGAPQRRTPTAADPTEVSLDAIGR